MKTKHALLLTHDGPDVMVDAGWRYASAELGGEGYIKVVIEECAEVRQATYLVHEGHSLKVQRQRPAGEVADWKQVVTVTEAIKREANAILTRRVSEWVDRRVSVGPGVG